MQKGDFRYKEDEKIIATVPPNDEPEPLVGLTEAQGERIIRLLEELVALTIEPTDKEIADAFKHHNASYPTA